MILSPMRFKNFVWPHNPRVYSITYERKLAVHKIPFGRHYLQSLGQTRRVLKGEGEFVGEGAYDTFKALATVFYEETPGTLVHPVWVTTTAWFAGLELRQEPRRDYVAYSFEFWEVVSDSTAELAAVTMSERGTAASGTAGGAAAGGSSAAAKLTAVTTGDRVTAAGGTAGGAAVSGSPATVQGEWYTVVKGDTLWGLSLRYGVSLSRLIDLNPDIRNPNLIYVGQRVMIH